MPVLARLPKHIGVDTYRPYGTVKREERGCGAEGCTTAWLPPWKNRARPIFEQEWGCSTRCLEKLVRRAVQRESGESIRQENVQAHRHRVPLGLVLLAQGWITHPQLQTALQAQRASGRGRIGDWLTESCGLEEETIARGLGVQWNCPVLKMDGFSPAAMALVMPKRFVLEFGVLPLRLAGTSMLYLAFAGSRDAVAALALEQMSGITVEHGLLASSDFELARASILTADAVPARMMKATHADAIVDAVVKVLVQKQPVACRLVRVHQYYWLRVWLEAGAVRGVGTLPAGTGDVEDYLFEAR